MEVTTPGPCSKEEGGEDGHAIGLGFEDVLLPSSLEEGLGVVPG